MIKIKCKECIATKQMKESQYCTEHVVLYDGQYIPECMIKLIKLDQSDRNFLTCQTYNLGMYKVCDSCNLLCPNNTKSKSSNNIKDLLNMIAPFIGITPDKLEEKFSEISKSLSSAEISPAISSLEKISDIVKKILSGNVSDNLKKEISLEIEKMKKLMSEYMIENNISKEQLKNASNEINSMHSLLKIKELLK